MTEHPTRQTATKSQTVIEGIAAEIGDLWRFTNEMQAVERHLENKKFNVDGPRGPCRASLNVSVGSAEKESEYRRDI